MLFIAIGEPENETCLIWILFDRLHLGACGVCGRPGAEGRRFKTAIWSGGHELGRIHVRASAEKDLAFLHDGDDVVEVRVCAERHAIRLRNAELWMSGDKRQKLWLPLLLDEGKCSDPIEVKGGPIRVTHLSLEYEAFGLDAESAHLSIHGLSKKHR